MSDSLQPHGLQHLSLTIFQSSPSSHPLNRWYHATISSSFAPFSSCPQSFPASGSFLMSWLFTSGGQSIGASASASVLPMNIQGWFSFRIDWFDLLAVQRTLKSFLQHSNVSVLRHSAFFTVQLSRPYMTTGKSVPLNIWTFVGTWCPYFLIGTSCLGLIGTNLSRFVIAFLPRTKCLLILWLQSPSTVILEPKNCMYSIFLELLKENEFQRWPIIL